MAESLLDMDIARLRRDLRAILSRGVEGLDVVFVRLEEGRNHTGATVLTRIESVGSRFEDEALHGIRRHCRRLRYMAEIDERLQDAASDAPSLCKNLQERLGTIHDNHVLANWLSSLAARCRSHGDVALGAEAWALATTFEEKSRGHHRDLLDQDPHAIVRRAMEEIGRPRRAA